MSRTLRPCTVDGERFDSLVEAESAVGCSHGYLSSREEAHGREFEVNGHRVVLSPAEHHRAKRLEPEPLPPPTPRAPVDFQARALADRRLYDERGVARARLLNRRPT
jgi:hypothetical protein